MENTDIQIDFFMKEKRFNPIIQAQSDGLVLPTFGSWAIEKYKLVGSYCDIFTSGMKKYWAQLTYIDLFAGAGYVQNESNGQIIRNAALIALSTPVPFTKYIFCEQDESRLIALEKRVKRDFPERFNLCSFIAGDSNSNIKQVEKQIPQYNTRNTMLSFCFVDPWSLNLNFTSIASLAKLKMDFLILQALPMDGRRNFENYYENADNCKIANYLGLPNWREVFESNGLNKQDFMRFLAEQYQSQMAGLGYLPELLTHPIKLSDKNVLLYYLTFYTKHPRGKDFFKKVKRNISQQTIMEFPEDNG